MSPAGEPTFTAARRVLRPGGWAAIWWGNQRGGTGFQLDTEARCDDLRRGARLVDVEYELIPSDVAMNADQVRALFNSMITIRRLPAGRRTHVLDTLTGLVNDAYGGTTTRPHLTALYLGRKPTARPPATRTNPNRR